MIASFSSAIIQAASTVNKAAPAKDHIDFWVSEAGGDLKRSNTLLKQDMSLDLVAFRRLADAAHAQSQAIDRMRKDSNVSIRQFRTEVASLRQEIQTIRSEQSRSQNSTAMYGSTGRQLKSSLVDPRGESKNRIMGVMKEADRLRSDCRDLQDQILKGR